MTTAFRTRPRPNPTAPECIEVYCDESNLDLLSAKNQRKPYFLIGSLWIASDQRDELKRDVKGIRDEFDAWGEIKWSKVSPSKLEFYKRLVDYFFENEQLRFRAIAVEAAKVNLFQYHSGDAELGFYKFYYQLLTHWIIPGSGYRIFCDDKVNRLDSRIQSLTAVLRNANRESVIHSVEARNSHEVVGIQLCDLLLGSTQWRLNGGGSSEAKDGLVLHVESHLGHRIQKTPPFEKKFNVFNIRLSQ